MTEAIGWLSSLILLATISKQVWKQWKDESSEGVSRWLFIGQIAASLGFTVYSWLVHNWVFVVTNALMLCSAIAGGVILARNRRRAGARGTVGDRRDHPVAGRASGATPLAMATSIGRSSGA